MSVDTWIIDSEFSFSNIDKAFESIKSNNFNYEYEDLDKSEDIFKAFEIWSLSLISKESGVFNIQSTGDCLGDEEELFNAIAPYINKDGFIKLGLEEGEVIEYKFNGKNCKGKSSKINIDGNYDLVFINTEEIKLSDAVKNLDNSFNCIINNNHCKVLYKGKVCACISISQHGQKLFKRFQFEQGEVIEAKIADGDIERIEKLLSEAKSIILVKFSEVISLNDFMKDYEINWEAFNAAKQELGICSENYLGLCKENGIYCIPQEGYFNLNSDEPILNLDY